VFILLTKYYSGDLTKKNKAGGTCNTNGERERERERGAYRDLVGRPDGKRPTWKTQALMGG